MDDATCDRLLTLLEHHADMYRSAADGQHAEANRYLVLREFSAAATAAHRALQFERQAEAVETVTSELLAKRLTGEL